MTVSLKYPVTPPTLSEPVQALFVGPSGDVAQKTIDDLFLGCTVIRPFQRDGKGDFNNACNEDSVRAAVGQILATVGSSEYSYGELPWRPEFGSLLYLLRHLNNDLDIVELARVYVIEALRKWEARINVKAVRVLQTSSSDSSGLNVLEISVRYDIVDQRRGSTLIPNVDQTERVALAA